MAVTGGWFSWVTLIARFLLTTSAALILMARPAWSAYAPGSNGLGLPDILSAQLLLLYRYLFVLAEEIMRMARARSLRSFGSKGHGTDQVYANMLGHLLIRTVARAQRVYDAMRCRGFDGSVRIRRTLHMRPSDWVFVVAWSFAFVVFRVFDVPVLIGELLTGLMS